MHGPEVPGLAAPFRVAQPYTLHWPDALRSAGVAGLMLAFALGIPYAWLFVLMMAAGVLAVGSYARRSRAMPTPAMGARLGMLGGLVGWAVSATIFALELAAGGGQLAASLRAALQQKIAAGSDPRVQEILSSPGGLTTILAVVMLVFLVVVLICSAIGGALGAKLLKRNPE